MTQTKIQMGDTVSHDWLNDDQTHDGGQSFGPGFCIAWQRGPLMESGRNGAFLLDILRVCAARIIHYQAGKFACDENDVALEHLNQAIASLESRLSRRESEGKLGTTKV